MGMWCSLLICVLSVAQPWPIPWPLSASVRSCSASVARLPSGRPLATDETRICSTRGWSVFLSVARRDWFVEGKDQLIDIRDRNSFSQDSRRRGKNIPFEELSIRARIELAMDQAAGCGTQYIRDGQESLVDYRVRLALFPFAMTVATHSTPRRRCI